MKKILLTLLVGFVGLISFSNAQFVVNYEFNCTESSCGILPFSFKDDWSCTHYNSINSNESVRYQYNCYNLGGGGGTVKVGKTVSPSSLCGSNPLTSFSFTTSTSDYSVMKCKVSYLRMPVSQLNPVIDGLTSTINEFVPFVAQVGIGVLLAVIGFVAIKWLMNRIRKKVLSVFKKK